MATLDEALAYVREAADEQSRPFQEELLLRVYQEHEGQFNFDIDRPNVYILRPDGSRAARLHVPTALFEASVQEAEPE